MNNYGLYYYSCFVLFRHPVHNNVSELAESELTDNAQWDSMLEPAEERTFIIKIIMDT